MFFTRLGRVVAVTALIIGTWYFAGGLMVANGVFEQLGMSALARYFGSTGAVIDRGMYIALFGIAFGILTEIRCALRLRGERQ